MKIILKRVICLMLCVLVLCSSLNSIALAEYETDYPEGVTVEEVYSAIKGTDALLNNIVPTLTGQSLPELVKPMLYSDDSLSDIVVSLYLGLSEKAGELKSIGLDFSVNAVANALGDYPEVKKALSNANSWEEVNLSGIKWGITDANSFATAFAKALTPFNELLYMILCSGTYKFSGFMKIEGENGYETAIVPMLTALKCTDLMSQEEFTADADKDRSNMLKNILLPVFAVLDKCFEAPADNLSELLPAVAYFIQSGELDACMELLLAPVYNNSLVQVAVYLKLIDLESMKVDVSGLLETGMSDITMENGLKLAPIDLKRFSKFGSHNGLEFESDKGKAYVGIMRWLIDTLKLNKKALPELVRNMEGQDAAIPAEMFDGLLDKDTDELLSGIILLFAPAKLNAPEQMIYPDVDENIIRLSADLTEEDYQQAIDNIDKLINAFTKESGDYQTVGEALSANIYTSKNISAVLTGVYGALEKEGVLEFLSVLGVDATPKGVAECIKADYPNAYNNLASAKSWSKLSVEKLSWGFEDGSRRGFQNAFVAVLRPLNPVLRILLADEDMVLMDSITIKGAAGYNTGIIPILEALGCKEDSVKAYEQYASDKSKDALLNNIAEPIFNVLDEVFEAPVKTLTAKLPNIVYFMNSGSLEKCISNLLIPLTAMASKLSFVAEVNFDISDLTKEFDLNKLLSGMLKDSGIEISGFDINSLSGMGKKVEKQSKSVFGGSYATYSYIEADQPSVFISLLRVALPGLLKNMKAPGSEATPEMFEDLFDKDPDALVTAVILLFTTTELNAPELMSYPEIVHTIVQFTPNLTRENYDKALNEIDDLLDDFVKEGGSYRTIETVLSTSIYTNKNITSVLTGIYGALEKEGLLEFLTILGIDATPKGVAECIRSDYPKAFDSLVGAKSWNDLADVNISWGFYNGSRRGFQNAFVAVLRPLNPVLEVLLAGEDMVLMDSITIKGADGYNTGIIPILEALGCEDNSVKTYEQYVNDNSKDALLNNIAEPIFDVLDQVFETPVKTLTAKLPNIVYFINSGSLENSISNVLIPITSIISKISVLDINLDTSALTENLDLNNLLSGMLKDSGMKIAEFDINSLAGIGTKVEKQSKSVIDGKNVTYSYIEADQTGVLMSLLRVLARTLKLPGNENLLVSTMGEGNDTFSTYSSSIGEQFAEMTEDELIEWLYNLFFKERAQIEIVFDEDYTPTIIYKEPEKNYTALYILGGFGVVAGIIGLIIFCNRKRLYY